MSFNPIQNYQQGFKLGEQQKTSSLRNQIAKQIQQGGFDPSSSLLMEELAALDPTAAARMLNTFQQLDHSRQEAFFKDARKGRQLLERRDFEGFLDLSTKRLNAVEKLKGDPTDIMSVMQSFNAGDINGTINQLKQAEMLGVQGKFLQDLTPKTEKEKVTANMADFLFHQRLVDEGRQDEADAFANKAGLSKLDPQQQAELALKTANLKQREKERTTRLGGFVNSGVGAADGVKNIRRSLELLKTVKTGGFDKAKLAAKQLFGIESADEGELSNNLGTNVLSQLKTIFGSAFTEKEGLRLERLEAGIGKSPAANKRILEKALEMTTRAAKRGGRAAKELGDNFAFEEIEIALKDALDSKFDFNQFTGFKVVR